MVEGRGLGGMVGHGGAQGAGGQDLDGAAKDEEAVAGLFQRLERQGLGEPLVPTRWRGGEPVADPGR